MFFLLCSPFFCGFLLAEIIHPVAYGMAKTKFGKTLHLTESGIGGVLILLAVCTGVWGLLAGADYLTGKIGDCLRYYPVIKNYTEDLLEQCCKGVEHMTGISAEKSSAYLCGQIENIGNYFSAGRKRNGHGHGICPLLCDNRRDVDGGCCVLNFIPSGTGENQGVLGKTGLFQEHEAPGAGSISGSRAVSARAVEDYGCYLSVMYRWSLDFKSQTLFGLWTGLGDSRCISGFGDGIISGSGGDFSDASGGQFPGGRISGFIWGDSGGKTDSGTQAHWESYGSFTPAGTAVRIFGDFFVRWFRFSSGTSVCASYLRNFKKFL